MSDDTDMEVERIVDGEEGGNDGDKGQNKIKDPEPAGSEAERDEAEGVRDTNGANGANVANAGVEASTSAIANPSENTPQPQPQPQPQKLGKRAKQTRQLVQMALNHIVEGWSYDNFAESFPAIAKDAPESLSSMREQTKDHFEASVTSSIAALHERRRVVESLNSLDDMLEEIQRAKRSKGTNFKKKGEMLANDPFLAYRVRRKAVLMQEHREMDERVEDARREMDQLVGNIKEMEAEEEAGESEKRELERLLGVVDSSTQNIPIDEMRFIRVGGTVLWSRTYTPEAAHDAESAHSPTNTLIKEGVIEGRLTSSPHDINQYRVHWGLENKTDLIFVIAYSKIIQLGWVDELLETAKALFVSLFKPVIEHIIAALSGATPDDAVNLDLPAMFKGWDEVFDQLVNDIDKKKNIRGKSSNAGAATRNATSNQNKSAPTRDEPKAIDAEEISKNVEAMKNRIKSKKARGGKKVVKGETINDTPVDTKKGKKEMRSWGDKISSKQMSELDYSSGGADDGLDDKHVQTLVSDSSKGSHDGEVYTLAEYANEKGSDEDDDLLDIEIPALSDTPQKSTSWGIFSSLPSLNVLKGKKLDKNTLQPVLSSMSSLLMKKNVASSVSEQICDSVEQQLVGRTISSFSSIKGAVKSALTTSITRVLTPKTSTDILYEISQKKKTTTSNGKTTPYSVVFCGVNGVGKSTNLSKVTYWLLENRYKVLIAACDTFRSGAVEQLRTHVSNLNKLKLGSGVTAQVELYERGYGKDASGIARDALGYGAQNGFDVVLIDTAGRMQDNEPLMRALAKLTTVNEPDKIIFVGEALVGNEATDQLVKFDRALKDLSSGGGSGGSGRGIDGMLLTKFDTIDDKVGAALSMTYITGQPILFVGCGQVGEVY
ncbi:hypothetical protein E3P92_02812 [Wallemia ichthyophaga]|nr:hypothetical protein E3P91_03119 [Wallemia ichthyophaga]TIA80679.1 hypothetical protein E3P98_02555 [Wallemia ichthyophaga]TIB11647.1 hypothetical protein E3P92_02812 [Wallemia ichthyophaga]TIB61614.1 hypothetical protein E3P78_02710 [Wallemia ichthyophaga]